MLKSKPTITKSENFEILDYHLMLGHENVLLYYKGPFEEVILSKICDNIDSKFADRPRAGKRLFAIFIELAQNIAFYSEETNVLNTHEDKGIGTVLIRETDGQIRLTTGNVVKNDRVNEIVDKCEHINSLNTDELRELKKEIRSQPRKENHKGGSIGLIQVALKSENPLEVTAQPIDEDYSFFVISTAINK